MRPREASAVTWATQNDWSPGGDEEFLRTKDLIQRFSLEGVSRTNAVFDRPKLEWFNTQYLQRLAIEDLLPEVGNELKRSCLWKPEWADGAAPGPDGRDHAWFARTVDLLRPRIRLLPDFSTWARAFFSDEFTRDATAKDKFWKDPKVPELLAKLGQGFAFAIRQPQPARDLVAQDAILCHQILVTQQQFLINSPRDIRQQLFPVHHLSPASPRHEFIYIYAE